MADLGRRIRACLQEWDFQALFRQVLGWSAADAGSSPAGGRWLATRGNSAAIEVVCPNWPNHRTRQRLYRELQQQVSDPLIIWVSCDRTRSLWMWDQGQLPLMRHQVSLPVDRLARLHTDAPRPWTTLATALTPPPPGCDPTLAAGLNTLMAGLEPVAPSQRQPYAVTLFCRLVALAGLQQQGFLNGDEWYLQNQFGQSQQRGPDRFFSEVLQPLWFQGVHLPDWERPYAVRQRLGEIPYLAPGLFQRLPLEQTGTPVIADAAFEPLLVWLGDMALASVDLVSALAPALEGWVNQQQGAAFITPAAMVETLCDRILTPKILAQARAITRRSFDSVGDMLMLLSPVQAKAILSALLPLTWLDPACGSGRYLLALFSQVEAVLSALMAIAHTGKQSRPLPIAEGAPLLALRRYLLNHMGFGTDCWPEAVALARLQLLLWLLPGLETPDWLAQLPDPRMNVLTGDALIGLVTVDSQRFDQMQPRQSSQEPALQGNLLQPLLADDYDAVLRERQIRLEDYRSQTHLLAEVNGIPGYVQADFLSDRLAVLNQIAQTKLNQLLLHELSRQLGLRYRYRDSAGRHQQRLLTATDIAPLNPLHWGFHFHSIIRQGGFDLIISHPPAGVVQTTAIATFARQPDLFERKGITLEAFRHNSPQLRAIDPELKALWQEQRLHIAFLSDCFRRLSDYQHATQPPSGQRQRRLYWERLYLERVVQLLKPGGRAALLLPASLWQQTNGAHLRSWLQRAVGLDTVLQVSNHQGALGALPPRTALSLVSFVKGRATRELKQTAWLGAEAPESVTLGACLQGSVNLPVEVMTVPGIV